MVGVLGYAKLAELDGLDEQTMMSWIGVLDWAEQARIGSVEEQAGRIELTGAQDQAGMYWLQGPG